MVLLPPTSVVQTLAHNSTATLSVIRDYLVQKLQKQSQQIAQDELRVRRYREETTRIRQEIQELKARYLASRSVAHLGETLGMRTSMDHILASEQGYTRGHVR